MYNKAEPETVQQLFTSIADEYDRTNAILSFGFHKYWNQALIRKVAIKQPNHLLDLCAGTGEIAFGFLKKNSSCQRTYLLDFCPKMLQVAEKKKELSSYLKYRDIETLVASAEEIPLKSTSIDAVTIAYGIRNVLNPKNCYQEVFRVLKPGGTFYLLELTRPTNFLLKFFHSIYLKTLLPFLGRLTTKDKAAYVYLSKSVQQFSNPEIILNDLKDQGFLNCKKISLMGGIATLILSQKP